METQPIQTSSPASVPWSAPVKADAAISFASEFTEALLRRQDEEKNRSASGGDADSTNKMLSSLKNFSGLDFNSLTSKETEGLSQIMAVPEKEVSSTLAGLRDSLMSGIKFSLQRLETIVKDPANKVPSDLQSRFLDAIGSIKQDFTTGFGVDYDSVDAKELDSKSSDLINSLFSAKDRLPERFRQKLDLVS